MDAFGITYLAIGALIGLLAGVVMVSSSDSPQSALSAGACTAALAMLWPAVVLMALLWLVGRAIIWAGTR